MQKWVVANWKMHGTKALVAAYQQTFRDAEKLIVAPPFVYLHGFSGHFAAQNVHYQADGAYTGEISARMLSEIGGKYCLVGHSERRHYFGEGNDVVKAKANSCIAAGITPIICIGETEEEYLAGLTTQVLEKQLQECIPATFWLAYEPVWAIGTGKTPTIAEITHVHAMLRGYLPSAVLLYGGSVNPGNAAAIFGISNVDGVLVGGASLDVTAINAICVAASGC